MANSRAKFVVYKMKGQWRWKLVVRGKTVAKSPQGWAQQHHARGSATAVSKNAAGAPVVVDE